MSVKLCSEHMEQAQAFAIKECPLCRIAELEAEIQLLSAPHESVGGIMRAKNDRIAALEALPRRAYAKGYSDGYAKALQVLRARDDHTRWIENKWPQVERILHGEDNDDK